MRHFDLMGDIEERIRRTRSCYEQAILSFDHLPKTMCGCSWNDVLAGRQLLIDLRADLIGLLHQLMRQRAEAEAR